MGLFTEFKTFALKGNVVDLAVGVIIGAAFGKIVSSLVDDVMMPVLGAFLGSTDFSNHFIALGSVPDGTLATLAAHKAAEAPAAPAAEPIETALLREIRDSLRRNR